MTELTRAQEEVLRAFAGDRLVPAYVENIDSTLHAFRGCSLPTARALVRMDLARWVEEPHMITNYGRVGRSRYQTVWAIELTTYGKRMARECKTP